jgi:large subunit ribosomal protein L36
MKRRSSIRSLKNRPGSVVVKRHGKVFVINRSSPRFKTRQA